MSDDRADAGAPLLLPPAGPPETLSHWRLSLQQLLRARAAGPAASGQIGLAAHPAANHLSYPPCWTGRTGEGPPKDSSRLRQETHLPTWQSRSILNICGLSDSLRAPEFLRLFRNQIFSVALCCRQGMGKRLFDRIEGWHKCRNAGDFEQHSLDARARNKEPLRIPARHLGHALHQLAEAH